MESAMPGRYAGNTTHKVFGRLDCASGKRMMKPENRVFFLTWEDAIVAGIGLANCKPTPEMNMVSQTGPRFRPVFYLPKRRAEAAEAVRGSCRARDGRHRRYAARPGPQPNLRGPGKTTR